jgi:hypothetical protein
VDLQGGGVGKGFLRDVESSLHMTFDSYDRDVAHIALTTARESASSTAALKSTTPCRHLPRPSLWRRARCCWVLPAKCGDPVHGFMPLSKAVEVGAATGGLAGAGEPRA